MRDLQFQDMFIVIRIIEKADLTSKLQALFSKNDTKNLSEKELGLKFALTLGGALGVAKIEVAELFASLTDKKVDEILSLSLIETMALIKEFAELEGLKGFLQTAFNIQK